MSTISKKDKELELNQHPVPPKIFMESYNQSLPVSFPRASIKLLKIFRAGHPMMFTRGNMWSIDKHRKRFMDWISSNRDEA